MYRSSDGKWRDHKETPEEYARRTGRMSNDQANKIRLAQLVREEQERSKHTFLGKLFSFLFG
jgi:hypothetical protein